MAGNVTVIVDTREQLPLSFDEKRFVVERRALPAGDYSLGGLEHNVVVERKTLQDFVHTVIRDRERFRKELLKLAEYDRACVVVEAGLDDIVAGAYRSGAHPASVVGAAISIIIDYGIPVFFCSNRQCACRFVEEYLLRYHRRSKELCQQQQPSPFESVERSSESSTHPPTSQQDDS
ncbi:MAG: ERCC4 domain-containing protein [Armatimonadota bacterium]